VRTLPPKMVQALTPFAPLFSERVFRHARVLLIGAILAPGRKTVSSALRAMGLEREKRFHRYHRVLSRARWSSREVNRVLLGLLVEVFVPEGDPLVVGIDERPSRTFTLEPPGARICLKEPTSALRGAQRFHQELESSRSGEDGGMSGCGLTEAR
jgi:hypothetical protein